MTPGSRAAVLHIIPLFIVTIATQAFAQFENIPPDGELYVTGRQQRGGYYAYGGYSLTEGILSKTAIRIQGAIFTQTGGTNIVHGDLTLTPGWFQDRTTYNLTGGRLITSNTTVGPAYRGGFVHNGGVHLVRNFGSNSAGLNAAQLAQIRFRNPYGSPPGDYRARLRANGELVPVK